jgi:hypothetical protein
MGRSPCFKKMSHVSRRCPVSKFATAAYVPRLISYFYTYTVVYRVFTALNEGADGSA